MPVEVLPTSPSYPRAEDNPEHSFPTSLRRAVDTLFTYQPIAMAFQEAPQDEETAQFIELWKQGIATYLEDSAKAAVTAFLEVFAKVQSGELVATRDETRGLDPYVIAEAAYGARLDQLQQSGELRRPSEITDEYTLTDHFDDLRKLYKETCLIMGLAWPPPLGDEYDLPEER